MSKVIHFVGLPCLLASTTLGVFAFYRIVSQGYFIGREENKTIAILELVMMIVAFLYWLFLVKLLIF